MYHCFSLDKIKELKENTNFSIPYVDEMEIIEEKFINKEQNLLHDKKKKNITNLDKFLLREEKNVKQTKTKDYMEEKLEKNAKKKKTKKEKKQNEKIDAETINKTAQKYKFRWKNLLFAKRKKKNNLEISKRTKGSDSCCSFSSHDSFSTNSLLSVVSSSSVICKEPKNKIEENFKEKNKNENANFQKNCCVSSFPSSETLQKDIEKENNYIKEINRKMSIKEQTEVLLNSSSIQKIIRDENQKLMVHIKEMEEKFQYLKNSQIKKNKKIKKELISKTKKQGKNKNIGVLEEVYENEELKEIIKVLFFLQKVKFQIIKFDKEIETENHFNQIFKDLKVECTSITSKPSDLNFAKTFLEILQKNVNESAVLSMKRHIKKVNNLNNEIIYLHSNLMFIIKNAFSNYSNFYTYLPFSDALCIKKGSFCKDKCEYIYEASTFNNKIISEKHKDTFIQMYNNNDDCFTYSVKNLEKTKEEKISFIPDFLKNLIFLDDETNEDKKIIKLKHEKDKLNKNEFSLGFSIISDQKEMFMLEKYLDGKFGSYKMFQKWLHESIKWQWVDYVTQTKFNKQQKNLKILCNEKLRKIFEAVDARMAQLWKGRMMGLHEIAINDMEKSLIESLFLKNEIQISEEIKTTERLMCTFEDMYGHFMRLEESEKFNNNCTFQKYINNHGLEKVLKKYLETKDKLKHERLSSECIEIQMTDQMMKDNFKSFISQRKEEECQLTEENNKLDENFNKIIEIFDLQKSKGKRLEKEINKINKKNLDLNSAMPLPSNVFPLLPINEKENQVKKIEKKCIQNFNENKNNENTNFEPIKKSQSSTPYLFYPLGDVKSKKFSELLGFKRTKK